MMGTKTFKRVWGIGRLLFWDIGLLVFVPGIAFILLVTSITCFLWSDFYIGFQALAASGFLVAIYEVSLKVENIVKLLEYKFDAARQVAMYETMKREPIWRERLERSKYEAGYMSHPE